MSLSSNNRSGVISQGFMLPNPLCASGSLTIEWCRFGGIERVSAMLLKSFLQSLVLRVSSVTFVIDSSSGLSLRTIPAIDVETADTKEILSL